MSRLTPKHTGFNKPNTIPPAEATTRTVSIYFGNSVWHLRYLHAAFNADGMADVAKLLAEALVKVEEARQVWKSK